MYTDSAASIGYADVLDTQLFSGQWSQNWKVFFHSISRAFSNRALDLWCERLTNRCIIFHTDNMSIVNIINSQTSRDVLIMYLVRKLAISAMLYNIMFRAVHIPGYDNCIADCFQVFRCGEQWSGKLAGVSDPIQQFLVQKMLVGARKLKPQCDVRLPITPDIFRLLIKAVDATLTAPYYNSMLKAIFLFTFHALLRVEEFTITNTSDPHHTLQLGDVSFLSKDSTESLSITMNSYKHCHRSPTVLHIAIQDGILCPVATYQKYIRSISQRSF